ncbi:secreted protein [Melampsora americana]|nr:secreted protein [Melampsora americana]
MFSRATILLLFVFCFTYTVSKDAPRNKIITCRFGYRVRNVTNGISEGMCTIADNLDDHVCHNCDPKIPKGLKCVESKFDVPLKDLKKAKKTLSCPNYERLFRNKKFVGYGCAEAKQGQKARCLEIENP